MNVREVGSLDNTVVTFNHVDNCKYEIIWYICTSIIFDLSMISDLDKSSEKIKYGTGQSFVDRKIQTVCQKNTNSWSE